ncbi:hypothetical protein C1T17_06535 [Sphingobium sp. SCG-1]|uniref:nuclear transport factor 2 family protein n=1 Tax=Sphingobium sp. SCG-1 TaxID=2072936 RepID=UPI000CD69AE1|nr:nuclear transport factor 2 family protein [Sphingobium sp. SCG-1]AUW57816.1 hypothetical protein C1T17_06535 [Sphingobium sp. SCG-1]
MPDRDGSHTYLDCYAIDALIQRERAARDGERWDEMAACYHPDAVVEISWFRGSGAGFVAASRQIASAILGIHQMSPAVVTVRGERAIADCGCTMRGLTEMDGTQIQLTSQTRLLWRAVRTDGDWLVAGLRAYYLFDAIAPVRPDQAIAIDDALLASLRMPYRWIAYSSARAGRAVSSSLPGIDRPEEITALRRAEQDWLGQDRTEPEHPGKTEQSSLSTCQ